MAKKKTIARTTRRKTGNKTAKKGKAPSRKAIKRGRAAKKATVVRKATRRKISGAKIKSLSGRGIGKSQSAYRGTQHASGRYRYTVLSRTGRSVRSFKR